jgi:molybdate transport system substrate-binding protein
MKRWLAIVIAACALLLSPAAPAGEVKVAAAADLTFAMKELSGAFEKQTGNTLKITYGSSGNFFAQIHSGAPFDVFMSADVNYPRQLVADGLADSNSLYIYATGKIVLWVPSASKIDVQRGVRVLEDAAVAKIAIANPEHAPYGRAAVAAMRSLGIYDKVSSKLVLGENISQTAQFVTSGNADIGVLALSLALAPAMQQGRYSIVSSELYPAIEQGAVILNAAGDKSAARAFLAFLQQPATVAILQRYGFTAAPAAKTPVTNDTNHPATK